MSDFKRTTNRTANVLKPRTTPNNLIDAPDTQRHWRQHGYKGNISFMTATGRKEIFDLDRDTKFPIFPLEDVKAINISQIPGKYFQRQLHNSAGLHSSAAKPPLPPLQGLTGKVFAEAWAASTPWSRHEEGGLNVRGHVSRLRLIFFVCQVVTLGN
jgi:hypothetical protein